MSDQLESSDSGVGEDPSVAPVQSTDIVPDGGFLTKTRTLRISGGKAAIIDENAKKRLAQAAAAVGLSLEELVNLVADSGTLTLPPGGDGITEAYTVEDLGKRMWNLMNQMVVDEQPKWFAQLAKNQQIALLVTLRNRGLSSVKIAEDLDLSVRDVNRANNEYAGRLGDQVLGLRLNTIAGNLQLVAERCMEGLTQDKAHAQVWKIQKELVAMFQAIGIVDRAAQKVEHEHTHRLDDERQREIQKMIELERKKSVRTEEIKQAEVTVLDKVPDISLVEEMPF